MLEWLARTDTRLLLWLNGLMGKSVLLDGVMRLLVSDYFVPVSLVLFLVALWFTGEDRGQRERNQRTVFTALLGMGMANGFVALFNRFLDAARPFEEMPWLVSRVNQIFYIPSDPSFPSNVAASTFAMAAGVWLGNSKAGRWLFIPACLVCFARVYAGVHYPSDIVGGAAVGLLASLLAYAVMLPLLEPLASLILWVARKICLA